MVNENNRSSYQRCFVKKDVLRNFAKFTGKHLCQSLFFNKVAGNFVKKETLAQACNFIKKGTLVQVVSCEFCKISKNIFSKEHLRTITSLMRVIKCLWLPWQTLLRGRYNKTLCSFLFSFVLLKHFTPIFYFHVPWAHRKTSGFLMFWGGYRNGIEICH